ncbi:hypothetical protein [Melaminivora sp.]|uniref:hypothetical protein n=1 Tax=Melaminivora sp. TaxID=1933032 RepID=UPI0028A8DAA5|nr:hypothetical protein [Melaminivora sp.]
MTQPPRTPPRFVPTLTEVVHLPAEDGAPAPAAPATAALQLPVAADGLQEDMVHRLMQRVDLVLEHRLAEAIALVIEEQTRSIGTRLREEVETVVRQSVYEAVAEELTKNCRP